MCCPLSLQFVSLYVCLTKFSIVFFIFNIIFDDVSQNKSCVTLYFHEVTVFTILNINLKLKYKVNRNCFIISVVKQNKIIIYIKPIFTIMI
jgi:hypothetical protein